MRMVVIGLVLLAGVKVWTQDRTYRSVMGDALVEAYRERAVEVCRKTAAKRPAAAAYPDASGAWGAGSEAHVIIGNPDLEVAIWDTENPLWAERFRNPHLILTGGRAHCAYDVRGGTATLSTN
jgi:hypothetical protein